MKFAIFLLFILVSQIPAQEVENLQKAEEDLEKISDQKRTELQREKESLQTLLKTLHYSCIVLARMQLSRYGQELMSVIESYESKQEQNRVWQKIYTSHVIKCQQTITYEDSVKIFANLKTNDFDFDQYKHVYEQFSLDQFTKNDVAITFTPEEEKTWTYVQEFEKAMNVDTAESISEPKVFGFALNSSKTLQYITFVGFIALFGFLAYLGLKIPSAQIKKK